MKKPIIGSLLMLLCVKAVWSDPLTDAKEGLAAQKRGDYASARYFFARAIQNGATLSSTDLELAFVKIAEVDLQLGNHDAAWAEVQSALKINPSDPEAVHVYTQMQAGDAQKVGIATQCTHTCSAQYTSCAAALVYPRSFNANECTINGTYNQGCSDRQMDTLRQQSQDYTFGGVACGNQYAGCVNACKSACGSSCVWPNK